VIFPNSPKRVITLLSLSQRDRGVCFQIWDFAFAQQRDEKSQIEWVQAQPAAPRVVGKAYQRGSRLKREQTLAKLFSR